MTIMKHLPWIVPAAAIAAFGSGALDRLSVLLPTAENPVTAAATPTVAPAVTVAAAPTAKPQVEAANVSDQLAALLTQSAQEPAPVADVAPVAQDDVQVTRSQGFATETLAAATQAALSETASQPDAPADQSGPIGADFFNAAQANLAQANSCANDLRNLAGVAKVYFPSGGLTGEAAGMEQARLIGTIAARCQGVMIEVQGHSDPSGDPAVNLRLSQERADAVVARLSAMGINTSKFLSVGLGSARPSGVTGAQPDAYYDRRVEFTVLDAPLNASFNAPASTGGANFGLAACVVQLQNAAAATNLAYAPGSVTVSGEELSAALRLAELAQSCPQARLRVVGQHAEEYGTIEDAGTGRMRAIALVTTLAGAGFPAEKIIMAAPSESQPIDGLSNSRVDFDVLVEDL